jgi:hypothetical protein
MIWRFSVTLSLCVLAQHSPSQRSIGAAVARERDTDKERETEASARNSNAVLLRTTQLICLAVLTRLYHGVGQHRTPLARKGAIDLTYLCTCASYSSAGPAMVSRSLPKKVCGCARSLLCRSDPRIRRILGARLLVVVVVVGRRLDGLVTGIPHNVSVRHLPRLAQSLLRWQYSIKIPGWQLWAAL